MNILVFNPSFLGDSVLTTPLVHALHTYFPAARISLVVRPEFAPLFTGIPQIAEVIPFSKRGEYKGMGGILRFGKVLKEKRFDMIVSPHKSLRSTLVNYLSGAPVRVGFSQSALSFLYTHTVTRNMTLHEVHRNLMLLSALIPSFSLEDATAKAGAPATVLDEATYQNAKEFFRIAASGNKVVAMNPGSVWATKRWPSDRFAEVARRLHHAGYRIALIGGPSDVADTDAVKSLAGIPVINLANRTSLRELPAYIKACDLLITNDSGPLHIAVSQGTPALAIFGPTVRELGFFPYDSVSRVIETDLPCRPCGLHGGNRCPKSHFRCMLDITADTVYDAAVAMLAGGA